MRYIPRLLHYVRPYWKLAVLSVIITVLAVVAGLLAPWPLKILIDSVLGDHPLPPLLHRPVTWLGLSRIGLLVAAVLAGFFIVLLDNAFTVLNSYVNTKIEQSMILDFRSDMFQHAQRLSMTFHDRRRSGMVIYAINNQADGAAGLLMALQPLAQSLLTLVGMFWVLMTIDRQLALLSLTIVPILYYAVGYYIKHIQTRLEEVKNMEGETLSIIHEAISMLRVIVAFGREDHEFRRFRTQGERAVDARIKLTVRETFFSLAVNLTTAAGTALVLGFGAFFALQGRLTGGDLLVVMAYIAAVYQPLESISYTLGSLQDQIVSLRMAFRLLDTDPDITDDPGAIAISRSRGHVKFEDVHFSYSGRVDTLKAISFEAQPGQIVGIVGQTGAGKSTLVSLIPRFYDPNQGRILLDGQDIRKLTLRSLREQVSIVLQEPLLFSGSIADNIRYGNLEAGMEAIIEAAKGANAHDFIMRLPQQYETELGERGVQLSGGERQRIAVARAFLKDAPILILDEPTSAIDSKTEAVILEALERLMVGRTTFMIAHRLSTINNADMILVLEQGELVEQGTHEQLVQQEGLYRQLYEIQLGRGRRKSQPVLHFDAVGAPGWQLETAAGTSNGHHDSRFAGDGGVGDAPTTPIDTQHLAHPSNPEVELVPPLRSSWWNRLWAPRALPRSRRAAIMSMIVVLLLLGWSLVLWGLGGFTGRATGGAPKHMGITSALAGRVGDEAATVIPETTPSPTASRQPTPVSTTAAAGANLPAATQSAEPQPTLGATSTPSPLPSPTMPVPTVTPSSIALPDLVKQVIEAEARLRSGELDAVIDYTNGTRSSARMRFDLGEEDSPPRFHITSTYQSSMTTQTTERIVIGEQLWQRQPDGRWTAGTMQEGLWGELQGYMPHAEAAQTVVISAESPNIELSWYDPGRDADVVLTLDRGSNTPAQLRRTLRKAGLSMNVQYNGWDSPVDIVPPDGL